MDSEAKDIVGRVVYPFYHPTDVFHIQKMHSKCEYTNVQDWKKSFSSWKHNLGIKNSSADTLGEHNLYIYIQPIQKRLSFANLKL